MFRFVQVSITYQLVLGDPSKLEPMVQKLSREWCRLSQNVWMLWTDKSPVTISEMLKAELGEHDQLFVCSIDRSTPPAGWVPQWFWDWLNRPRNDTSGENLYDASQIGNLLRAALE